MKRRDAGDGTIFQQPNGRWTGMLDLGRRPDGRRHRRKVSGRTKAEVKAKLDEVKREAELGIAGTTSRQTVAEFLDWWADKDARGTVTESTLANYEQVIRLYLKPNLGAVELKALRPDQVTDMLHALEAAGLSARTRQLARAVLRRALRRAETLGMVARNVAALTEPPKQGDHKTDDMLSAEEVQRVLAAAAKDRNLGALAVVTLSLGLRKGEALALRWPDVDLEAGELTVRHTIKFPKGGGWELAVPKTEAGVRTIPLPATVLDALQEHRRRQLERQLAAPIWDGTGFVFTTSGGTPIHQRNASRWWYALLKEAGVPRRRMYASRHTAATLLLEQGVPLEVVSAILGHASLSITADIYAKVTQDAKRRALATFDRLAGP